MRLSVVRAQRRYVKPFLAAALWLNACGTHIPRAELRPHVDAEKGVCVPYPPAPARVDEMTKRPSASHVWIDGEWAWNTRRYAWRRGSWVVPEPKQFYARSTLIRLENGALALFPAHWHNTETPTLLVLKLKCPTPVVEAGDAGSHDADVSDLSDGALDSKPTSVDVGVSDADLDTARPKRAWELDATLDIIQPPP